MESRTLIAPPRVAVRVLEVAMPTPEGDAIAGDLHEEFVAYIVPMRGVVWARAWYCWQVARSLAPLFFRSWQRASVMRASTALVVAAIAATIPATALLVLRSYVLSQVPLKAAPDLSPSFLLTLAATAAVTALLGFVVGIRLLQPRK